ncbi:hypothetical protein Taro_027054 [Colocasia esculenta]|uniref:Uncharacterized protein n=1 Tax=Colocasia esculenta TaxID=4460 RepID=A0A843V7P7_COLES|nr:hypothetical protein [Colocasia esculenta]
MFPLFVHPLRGHAGSAPVANGWNLPRGASRARSFGASAVVRLEYESDEEWEVSGGGKPDACGEVEGSGIQWVFMGSHSSQKHDDDTWIAALLGVHQEFHPRSSLYKKVLFAPSPSLYLAMKLLFEEATKILPIKRHDIYSTKNKTVIADAMSSIDISVPSVELDDT